MRLVVLDGACLCLLVSVCEPVCFVFVSLSSSVVWLFVLCGFFLVVRALFVICLWYSCCVLVLPVFCSWFVVLCFAVVFVLSVCFCVVCSCRVLALSCFVCLRLFFLCVVFFSFSVLFVCLFIYFFM